MSHWHIIAINDRQQVINTARYDNAAKSVGDFLDLAYTMYPDFLEKDDRTEYAENMLRLTEEFQSYHIYLPSKKLNLSWTDCQDDPCTFALYN